MGRKQVAMKDSPWKKSQHREASARGHESECMDLVEARPRQLVVSSSRQIPIWRTQKFKPDFVGTRIDIAKLNYRSNIAGIVKVLKAITLSDGHIQQLRKTPFWLMFNAILSNNLKHSEFNKCDEDVLCVLERYDPASESFVFGSKHVLLTKNDLRLIFGIQCGSHPLDVSYGTKPASDFIQRRCPSTNRITSKTVRGLIDEALKGNTTKDEEDVAKLLCLYTCSKLFFSTSGETIGWAFIQLIDDLDSVKKYDWSEAIRGMLIGSLQQWHTKPEKVTGCTVALLYWLCEHTTLIEPDMSISIPRFLKWNLVALHKKIKGTSLVSLLSREVRSSTLRVTKDEKAMLIQGGKFMGECDKYSGSGSGATGAIHGDSDFVTNIVGDNVDIKGKGKLEPSIGSDVGDHGLISKIMAYTSTTHEEDLITIAELELASKQKNVVIAELRNEIENLKASNMVEAKSLVVALREAILQRDVEITRMGKIIEDLRASNAGLEDELADHAVHFITQEGVANENVLVDNKCDEKMVERVVHLVTQQATTVIGAGCVVPSGNVGDPAWGDDIDIEHPDDGGKYENNNGVEIDKPSNEVLPLQNSLVRKIKKKERRERKLPEYEYPIQTRRQKRHLIDQDDKSVVGKVGSSNQVMDGVDVIDVDVLPESNIEKTEFGINNRNPIWKLLTDEEKAKLAMAHSTEGDRAIIWIGPLGLGTVFFADIRALIREKDIRGNVIDVYAEMLLHEQESISIGKEFPDKSYFFNSFCGDFLKDVGAATRERYLSKHMVEAVKVRYVHFPIFKSKHWTILVMDTEEGTLKHYNSMKPRRGIEDIHLREARELKHHIEEHTRGKIEQSGLADVIMTQDLNGVLESVANCPQQKSTSVDCAIFVCYIMHQYVHHGDIDNTIVGDGGRKFRTSMVRAFMNDPIRSWRQQSQQTDIA